jgi:hypothetical protein
MTILRAVVLCAFLSAGLCGAMSKCVAKDKEIHGFTEGTFVPMFLGLVAKSLSRSIESHPGFKATLASKGKCQFECFHTVATESARFQWTGMNAPPSPGSPKPEDMAKQMLLGAFEACYPGLATTDHAALETVMNAVVAGMGDYGSVAVVPLVNPSTKDCPGKSTNEMVDLDMFSSVVKKFGASQETVLNMPKYAPLKNFLSKGAFDCQEMCIQKTSTAAIMNLWQSGVFAVHPGMMVASFTGSMKACYPSVPRDLVVGFAKDVMAAATKQAQAQRLDDATIPNLLQTATSSGFMVAAFVGSALLVSALLIVKRKSQQTKRDMIAVSGQNDLETDLGSETENLALE